MNEKYVEALEQYDMEVRTVRKGRGSWICETDQGCRLLKEYRGQPGVWSLRTRSWGGLIPGEV